GVVEDDATGLGLVAVQLGLATVAHDHRLFVGEVGDPRVIVGAWRKADFGGLRKTVFLVAVAFTSQCARIALQRYGQISVDHETYALLRRGRAHLVEQDGVVVDRVNLGNPLVISITLRRIFAFQKHRN